MSCRFCARVFGLRWLCCCDHGKDAAMVQYGLELEAERAQNDPDEWYAAELERLRERAPA